MIAITLLLLAYNMAMNPFKKGKNGFEEAGRAIEKLEGEPKLSASPPQIPHSTGSVFVGPHFSHPYGVNPEVKYGL